RPQPLPRDVVPSVACIRSNPDTVDPRLAAYIRTFFSSLRLNRIDPPQPIPVPEEEQGTDVRPLGELNHSVDFVLWDDGGGVAVTPERAIPQLPVRGGLPVSPDDQLVQRSRRCRVGELDVEAKPFFEI